MVLASCLVGPGPRAHQYWGWRLQSQFWPPWALAWLDVGLWDPGLVQFVWWVGLCLSINSQAGKLQTGTYQHQVSSWLNKLPKYCSQCLCPQFQWPPVSLSQQMDSSLSVSVDGSLSVSVDGYDLGAFQITVFVFFVLIPRHGIAGSYGTSIFNFLRKLYDFSLWLYQFTFPITVHKVSLFSTSLPAIVICCLLMIAILIGVR